MLRSNELSLRDGLGVILFTAVAASTHGLWGVVAGTFVLAIAFLTSGTTAFVGAQLWIIAFLSQERLLTLAAAQVAVFPLLVGRVDPRFSRVQLVSIASAYVGSLAVVWALVSTLRWLWQSALVFVAIAASLSYVLHRYERVTLGLAATEEHR
ncbi:hypothetical protein [Haloferax sp. YSMS24]|uniref:hypothetical protein n=1 Tax=unclassified Haloferax TaxID=2625095 RepID=UPI00398CA32E